MPDEAPDRVIATVLLATAAAPQTREVPRIGRWRSLPMNRFSLGAAAVAIVALVGGGLIVNRLATPPTGVPSAATGTSVPSTGPTPDDSPKSPQISFLPSVGQNGPIVMIVDESAVAIERDGSRVTLPLEDLISQSCPTFSPDGRTLAYVANPDGYENRYHQDLRVSGADGSNVRVLWTGLRVGLVSPRVVWSPDGQLVALTPARPLSGGPKSGLAVARLDGRPATESRWAGDNLSWSPDGTRLVGTRLDAKTGYGVIEVHEPASGTTTTLLTVPDVGPVAWSPDGETISYVASSVPGGHLSVHVIGTDGTNDRVVWSSSRTPTSMRWSPAGDLLMVVDYDDLESGPSFTIELLDRDGALVGSVGPVSGYDEQFTWSPDGRRLLGFTPMGATWPSTAQIISLEDGESTVVDVPPDYYTACPIAWGAATP
jgi:Tol biopolymer transport system component